MHTDRQWSEIPEANAHLPTEAGQALPLTQQPHLPTWNRHQHRPPRRTECAPACMHTCSDTSGDAHRPALTDLQGHGPRHDVSGGQVLGDGGVPLHEPLALTVNENAALSTAPLRDETAGTVYPCKDPVNKRLQPDCHSCVLTSLSLWQPDVLSPN